MLASYLGVASPAATAVAGTPFSGQAGPRRVNTVVDAGAWNIEAVQMPGDHWRAWHDAVANFVFSSVFESGLQGQTEVRGIFSAAVPADLLYHDEPGREQGARPSRPGAVPDARINVNGEMLLFDIKVITRSASNYWRTVRVTQVPGEMLARRAASVQTEYVYAARQLDAQVERARAGVPAPPGTPTVLGILRSYPPVRGLVFGSTACGGSREVGDLLMAAASSFAERQWRMAGARSVTEARAFYAGMLRRQWGFVAAREHARMRLGRLERLGHAGRVAQRYGSADGASLASMANYQRGLDGLGAGGGRSGFEGGGRMEYSGIGGRF